MYIENIFKKYKIKIKDSSVYDPIRKKDVHCTPEEKIRQKTICFLLKELGVPENRIGIEKSLSSLGIPGNKKRIDIGIFREDSSIAAIIECKADFINYNESPYQQAIDYVTLLDAKYYFVCDGIDFIGYKHEKENDQFLLVDEIPDFETIIKN